MKRYMPSLEGLDNGERPVLGVRDTYDLADLNLHVADAFTYDPGASSEEESTTVEALFDPYV